VKATLAATAALAALAIVPATADAKRGSIYDVTRATGFEKVTFTGDADGGCDLYGVCGYSGTVSYVISGKPRGTLRLTKGKNGKVTARASYKTNGVTHMHVTPPPDQGSACDVTLHHNTDVFDLHSRGSHNQLLMFTYHPSGPDYLDTSCAGPNEGAVSDAGVLPSALFQPSDFFGGTSPSFGLSGSTPFRAAGFSSTIQWKLQYKMKARACSPRCQL
jgi:hypothetical protein